MKRRSRLLVPLLVVLVALPLEGQLTPPSTGGAPEFDYLLQQVAESRRVLVIGAHPDDEDSGLLALLARAYGVQAAYLSLSRGDGGQNLIGPELGVGLGILRSRELEAARAIDGAHQFVTRAYDFGYSRSIDETAALWHPDSILKDAVRIVRRYRPHVIVSVFSGTARDGHGQHQMAGQIAHAVFEAAGDGRRFPELEREEGLSPWRPLKLYRSARFQAAGERVDLSTGELDPRLGLTYHQIAMASRSRHSSQDMGRSQPIGPQRTGVALVTDLTGAASPEFFAGIPREASWLASLTDSLRRTVAPVRLASAVPVLNAARERLRDEGAERRLDSLVQQTLAIAAGLLIDVTTDVERVVPGGVLQVSVHVYNAGPYPAELTGIRLTVPGGWSAQADDTRRSLPSGADLEVELAVEVPAGAHPSQPYHLMRPLQGGMYDWTDTEPAVRGELFEPPLITGTALVQVDRGLPIGLSREATYRYTDQAVGEVRRPLVVMPEMAVRLTPAVVAWSTRVATARTFSVTVTKYGSEKRDGEVVLEIEPWGVRQSQLFSLKSDGESRIFSFEVRRPAAVRDGSASVRASVVTGQGTVFATTVESVVYPHVRPTTWVRPAAGTIRVGALAVPEFRAVGYLRGASDRVPEALAALGLPIRLLDADELAHADLRRYDVIVVGSRAYETDSALTQHNGRLLAYVRDGGRLVVQYQQFQFARGNYAPFPIEIGRPTGRVTDETAPVTMLDPSHPIFRTPNELGPSDWEGWPQERGLYFAGSWDDRYVPLLEMADPGMPPLRGALLVARYGKGTYVYTGLSFFRALPAGAPGAFRLFLNLLAWKG